MTDKLPEASKAIIGCILVLLMAGIACSLPQFSLGNLTGGKDTTQATNQIGDLQQTQIAEQGTQISKPELPSSVLTEVAATIHVGVTIAAQTLQAQMTNMGKETPTTTGIPYTESPPELTIEPEQRKTQEATNIAEGSSDATADATESGLPFTPTLAGYTFIPPSSGANLITPAFRVSGVHLVLCNGGYTANFKIYSTASSTLESLSLQFKDRNTDSILWGPTVQNTPFLWTDKTCNINGFDRIYAGQTRYVGNFLGTRSLSLHTIQATIILCTKEDLMGNCYTAIAEFVVP